MQHQLCIRDNQQFTSQDCVIFTLLFQESNITPSSQLLQQHPRVSLAAAIACVAAFSSSLSSSVVYQSSSPLHVSWQLYIFLYVMLPFPRCCPVHWKTKGGVALLESGASGGLGQSSLEGRSHACVFSLWQEQNVFGELCALRLSFVPSSGINQFDGLETFSLRARKLSLKAAAGK